jgi:hypothetical protein
MKKVIVIYDDSRKPDQEIRVITGHKTFGNTIFKRQSLKLRSKALFLGFENVEAFMDSEDAYELRDEYAGGDGSVFKIYSDHEPMDREALKVLLEKSLYVHENYSIIDEDRVAAVMYPSFDEWLKAKDPAEESR